jgi:pyridoxamine 5'-phosphate oxidase
MDITNFRREYTQDGLKREDLQLDPIDQFSVWFEQACKVTAFDPNAMSLATASKEGVPSVRTVLLKFFDKRGFVFFTNYTSTKARQIKENPNVSLLFLWDCLERQVIIHGQAQKMSNLESLKYFVSRPLESQLASWTSQQSSVITTRKMLEMKWEEMKKKFANGKVPLPSFWGGYRVKHHNIEFWQGRKYRLHDRFLYTRQDDDSWEINRLAP